jgi:hypothetical protein
MKQAVLSTAFDQHFSRQAIAGFEDCYYCLPVQDRILRVVCCPRSIKAFASRDQSSIRALA